MFLNKVFLKTISQINKIRAMIAHGIKFSSLRLNSVTVNFVFSNLSISENIFFKTPLFVALKYSPPVVEAICFKVTSSISTGIF